MAASLLIGSGLTYMTWRLMRTATLRGGHEHAHAHADGAEGLHPSTPTVLPHHVHESQTSTARTEPAWSPWLFFLAFAFGPREPLIPLPMQPTAKASWAAVAATTVATMSAAVVLLRSAVSFLASQGLQRYGHAFAGAAILVCGLAITLGL